MNHELYEIHESIVNHNYREIQETFVKMKYYKCVQCGFTEKYREGYAEQTPCPRCGGVMRIKNTAVKEGMTISDPGC